ncbi:MAG TPA: sulfate ABC transporter substrate-binding protein, partial [Leptolyngbyaceae cyanobacterium M33_DOE_097]|nr:sulfate ABC transporter substrate-binding protein [Leptolyngbyaceae cyanobacterium M33_DOE_097]
FMLGALLSVVVAACSSNPASTDANVPGAGTATAQKQDVELTLVAYAVSKVAHDAIIPKFVEKWKAEKGKM